MQKSSGDDCEEQKCKRQNIIQKFKDLMSEAQYDIYLKCWRLTSKSNPSDCRPADAAQHDRHRTACSSEKHLYKMLILL